MLLGISILLLSACGQQAMIEDDKFTFEEEEFKEVYERVNDKNFPDNIIVDEILVNLDGNNRDEAVEFLKATDELMEYEEIERLIDSIEKDEDDIPNTIENGDITISYIEAYGDVSVSIYPRT